MLWIYINHCLGQEKTHRMHQPSLATTSPLHARAFIFTNAIGEIIFSDRAFLRMTKQKPQQGTLVKALHGVFDLDLPSATDLIEEIAARRIVQNRDLSIKTTTGSLKPSSAAGVGVYVDKDLFIGADLMLSPNLGAPGLEAPLDHADILQAYIDQAIVESRLIGTGTFFQTYITVHIETLQVLLQRIGGPQMR